MHKINKKAVALCLIAISFVTSCGGGSEGDKAPKPDSDSQQNYDKDSRGREARIPVDDAVYEITGTVVADVNSLTRQTKPAQGNISGPSCYGTSGCYGGGGGSFTGPIEAGKGFVRLLVRSSKPATDLATEGSIVVLKMSDTKATALLPGDVVSFKCRREFEAVAAVRENETFDQNKVATWELDFCRLSSTVIGKAEQP